MRNISSLWENPGHAKSGATLTRALRHGVIGTLLFFICLVPDSNDGINWL